MTNSMNTPAKVLRFALFKLKVMAWRKRGRGERNAL
jgi:hypothetical protein